MTFDLAAWKRERWLCALGDGDDERSRAVDELLARWNVEGPLADSVARHRGDGWLRNGWTCEVRLVGLRYDNLDVGLLSIDGPAWLLGTLLVAPDFRLQPGQRVDFLGWLRVRLGLRVILRGQSDCFVLGAPDFEAMLDTPRPQLVSAREGDGA